MSLCISGLGGLMLSVNCIAVQMSGHFGSRISDNSSVFDPARPVSQMWRVQFNDCSPEALRVGGLVSSISRGAGSSALVLLASCLGHLLTARVLLSLWQFECCLF